ncbi:MAG TPA: sialidase family protein [Thermoanaerobaculia bacterium]|nr:sialidase family protein [Thermoanaerobaculia bacterium]
MKAGFRFSVFLVLAIFASITFAATTPSSGTVTPSSPTVSFTGGPYALSNPTAPTGENPPVCTDQVCGVFKLNVNIPATDFNSYKASVNIAWTSSGTTTQGGTASDFDLYVYAPDLTGTKVGQGAGNTNPESTSFDASTGTYTIYVAPYDVSPTTTFQATVTLAAVNSTTRWPSSMPNPTFPAGTPRFFNYHAPDGVAEDAGEPSIGVNRKTEKVFGGIGNGGTVNYFGGFMPYMLSVVFDDRTQPATTTWNQAPLVLANAPRAFGDPILHTDRDTGRTFVSQELGLTPLGSTMEFTDTDGSPFTPSQGSGAPSGIDHQTVAAGPFAAPLKGLLYPNGVWYCSQSVADAVCSISLDGGMTFGPAVPMYTAADCSGLHGHIKIGRDGTAYVPNRGCGGDPPYHSGPDARQALIVSEDNGITWSIRPLPQSTTKTDRDPSVAVADDGTVYFAYQAGDGSSRVAVSKDKGKTWIRDTDIGAALGVKNSLFHAAVAGDGDRAAVAFFGTETGGDTYANPDFPGVWYLYIATTLDGGQTWVTQNATPGDPVQRGGICGDGACRNLLDFFDATIDKRGRVVVGYDDGCISENCIAGVGAYGLTAGNDFTAKAVIARQASGKRMYAAFDNEAGADVNPVAPPPPPAPATACGTVVATDAAGDATHPLLSANGGNMDMVDITALSFAVDGTNLVTTINVKNFEAKAVTGSLGTFYYATWTAARKNSDGSIATRAYGTRVSVTATGGITYTFGQYDQANDAFVGTTTPVTGSTTTGPNGALSVVVPLSLLGNPTIPATGANDLPAVIEPYAVAIIHEQAVRFTAPADRAPNAGKAGASWQVCRTDISTCIDDVDSSISYTAGWHNQTLTSASGGVFRMHSGSSPKQGVSLTASATKITFHYATSPKGGSAEVFIDGVSKGTISFLGSTGSTFAPTFGSSKSYDNLGAGSHTFELRNLNGVVYVDGFCFLGGATSASSTALSPTSGGTNTQSAGQTLTSSINVPAGAQAVSVMAESTPSLPVKILLVNPSGLTLATSDSANGIASIDVPVSAGGVYLVKVINVSLGSVSVRTAATAVVPR